MKKHFFIFITAFLLLFTAPSFAILLHIVDLDGNNEGVQNSFTFQSGDVELTISAWTASINTAQQLITPWAQLTGNYGVYKGSSGLGVFSNDNDGKHLDGGASLNVDDPDEGLLFQFSENFDFWGFAAGSLSANDDLNLSVVRFISPTEIVLTDVFINRSSSHSSDIFDTYPSLVGSAFMVWVDGDDDDVRITQTAFTQVPEPNSIAILGIFLLLMARRVKSL